MKNKFIKAFAITSSVCALMSFNCMTASAVKNDWDSSWTGGTAVCNLNSYCSSKNDGDGRNRACCIRDKGDTSSIYVYNKSSKAVDVTVWGEFSWQNPIRIDPTWCDGYTKISTNKWSVPKNSERFIPQYIGEKGLSYAHVHFNTSNTNGLWSADSSGFYPNADKK